MSPWDSMSTVFTTFVVLAICLLIVGIPPLYMTSFNTQKIYVAVLIPVLTVVGTILQFYAFDLPTRKTSRFLLHSAREIEKHRDYIYVEAEKKRNTKGYVLSRHSSLHKGVSMNVSTVSHANSERGKGSPYGYHISPAAAGERGDSFDIEREIKWIDSQLKKLGDEEDDFSIQPALHQQQKVLKVFLNAFFDLQKLLLFFVFAECHQQRKDRIPESSLQLSPGAAKTAENSFLEVATLSSKSASDLPIFAPIHESVRAGAPNEGDVLAFSPGEHNDRDLDVLKTVKVQPSGPPAAREEAPLGDSELISVDASLSDRVVKPLDIPSEAHVREMSRGSTKQFDPQTHSPHSSKAVTARPPTIALSRGNRFHSDSPSVFFYVVTTPLESGGKPPKGTAEVSRVFAFEANLTTSGKRRQSEGSRPLFKQGKNGLPYQSFFVNEQQRNALTIVEKRLVEFNYCRVEEERENVPTDLSSLAVKIDSELELQDSHVSGADSSPKDSSPRGGRGSSIRLNCEPFETAESFILGWTLLPNRAMRLTILYVDLHWETISVLSPPPRVPPAETGEIPSVSNLSNTRANTDPPQCMCVPVVECLVNDTFCVLLGATVYINPSGNAKVVELRGISIEDINSSRSSSVFQGGAAAEQKASIGTIITERVHIDEVS
ncbi:hypothetical protein AGDE_15071 [Angomonas deanei]|uniref:Uncharacterized protein n=1 Tax=Angomonas deanei TaxID=59799 RepID=A0A7G2CQ68_9TRYP|nr:hypothetical protein AGDE_15071 [Angomonas deanei]CAD2221121.1 hypothetical protein, conserved [Angomonas deanei]|eukprot:EPY19730.1 hypothetical protein AGDE_15071 [Angomonas deanei]